MDGELISHPVPATKTGKHPTHSIRAAPSIGNILANYLESSPGIADLLQVGDVTLVFHTGFSRGE